jgi:hypothetical protein
MPWRCKGSADAHCAGWAPVAGLDVTEKRKIRSHQEWNPDSSVESLVQSLCALSYPGPWAKNKTSTVSVCVWLQGVANVDGHRPGNAFHFWTAFTAINYWLLSKTLSRKYAFGLPRRSQRAILEHEQLMSTAASWRFHVESSRKDVLGNLLETHCANILMADSNIHANGVFSCAGRSSDFLSPFKEFSIQIRFLSWLFASCCVCEIRARGFPSAPRYYSTFNIYSLSCYRFIYIYIYINIYGEALLSASPQAIVT